jgi:hypothetical protein
MIRAIESAQGQRHDLELGIGTGTKFQVRYSGKAIATLPKEPLP